MYFAARKGNWKSGVEEGRTLLCKLNRSVQAVFALNWVLDFAILV